MLTPVPMPPDCGTQNSNCDTGAPAKYSSCRGPRQVGGDKAGFGAEQRDRGVLHRRRQTANRRQQSEGDRQRLRRALQLLHRRVDRVEPFERVADADWQVDEHQPKAISEYRLRIIGRAQIDGNGCPDGHSSHLLALRLRDSGPSAPASVDTSTSLTVQPSTWPSVETSSNGNGIGPRNAPDAGQRLFETRQQDRPTAAPMPASSTGKT